MTQRAEQGVSYTGSLIVTISAWTVNEWAAAIGLLLGILTYISGRLYSARREQREKHLAEIAEEREALEQETARMAREAARLELEIKQLELAGIKRRKVVRDCQVSGIRDQGSEEVCGREAPGDYKSDTRSLTPDTGSEAT